MAFVMNYRARPTSPVELREDLFVVGSSFQWIVPLVRYSLAANIRAQGTLQ